MTTKPLVGRGQITIPDIVFFAAAFVVLAGLVPVLYRVLNEQAPNLGTGTVMLYQIIVPALVVTVLLVFFAIAVGGAGQ